MFNLKIIINKLNQLTLNLIKQLNVEFNNCYKQIKLINTELIFAQCLN